MRQGSRPSSSSITLAPRNQECSVKGASKRTPISGRSWASFSGTWFRPEQSADLYELIISRHRVSSFIITSNGAVEEWLSLFEDPILGNSALDRLANASYQIVIEGHSYRERLSSHCAISAPKGVFDPSSTT